MSSVWGMSTLRNLDTMHLESPAGSGRCETRLQERGQSIDLVIICIVMGVGEATKRECREKRGEDSGQSLWGHSQLVGTLWKGMRRSSQKGRRKLERRDIQEER